MPASPAGGLITSIEIAGLKIEKIAPEHAPIKDSILFVHGIWAGAWVWREYLQFFSALGYVCFALNLRGRDGSRPVANLGRVSVYDYVCDVRVVAEALGNPILIGHSMGGLLVQKVAELLDPPAAVLISPAAPRGIFALNSFALLRAAFRHGHEILRWRPVVPEASEARLLVLNRLPPEEQARAYKNMVPESGRVLFEAAVTGLWVDQSKVLAPMLVASAGRDMVTQPKMVERIARKYRAEYRSYPQFAHMVILEPAWELVAGEIAAWLDGAAAQRKDS